MTLATMPTVSVSAPCTALTANTLTTSAARSITAEEALQVEAHLFERLVLRSIQHGIAEAEHLEIAPRQREPRAIEAEGSDWTAEDERFQRCRKRSTREGQSGTLPPK